MKEDNKDEYFVLTEKLEEIDWALEGKCNDIDCDKYMYADLLKKRYKPTLEHNFSCMKKLKIEKKSLIRILSQNKYKKYRYIKCPICKKDIDKLDNNHSKVVSFTRPSKNNKKYHEWKGVWTHNTCSKKVKTPIGWKKF